MDRNKLKLLMDSLNGNFSEIDADLMDTTVGNLTRSEKNIVFLVSAEYITQHMMNLGRAVEKANASWFEPIEKLETLKEGLFGYVNGVPVYSNWMHITPDESVNHKRPLLGVYFTDKNMIKRLPLEAFCD